MSFSFRNKKDEPAPLIFFRLLLYFEIQNSYFFTTILK
ncbi:hypothetical protein bwei_1694 [Bacillus mycoides]|nr:hypothetical protein bwei_1694 [Bacillus mycoides]EEL06140.1 hypothetical protein bcere0014_22360 [Bacillus cereus BDRD-ST196]